MGQLTIKDIQAAVKHNASQEDNGYLVLWWEYDDGESARASILIEDDRVFVSAENYRGHIPLELEYAELSAVIEDGDTTEEAAALIAEEYIHPILELEGFCRSYA